MLYSRTNRNHAFAGRSCSHCLRSRSVCQQHSFLMIICLLVCLIFLFWSHSCAVGMAMVRTFIQFMDSMNEFLYARHTHTLCGCCCIAVELLQPLLQLPRASYTFSYFLFASCAYRWGGCCCCCCWRWWCCCKKAIDFLECQSCLLVFCSTFSVCHKRA